MMNKRDERMEKLNNAGMDTNKYFTFELPEGLDPGTKIHLVFDDGQLKAVSAEDVVCNQIIEDGYVKNSKLHRRFVCAQMFKMLNYKSWDGRREGYNEALKNHGYDYTFKMMLEEVRVLSKLEQRDEESFIERSHFFTKEVVVKVCEDYMDKLKAYVDKLPNKNCKGVPYKRVKGKDIFVEDLYKKLYQPLQYKINRMKVARDYAQLYRELLSFMRNMVRLPWNTKQSAAWVDAYKGAGAFYTMKNLIMFHQCTFVGLNRDESMFLLNSRLDEYKGEGWRMFACMKKLIKDNDFSFEEAMRKQYNK